MPPKNQNKGTRANQKHRKRHREITGSRGSMIWKKNHPLNMPQLKEKISLEKKTLLKTPQLENIPFERDANVPQDPEVPLHVIIEGNTYVFKKVIVKGDTYFALTRFKIFNSLVRVLKAIFNNPVTALIAPTGTGKTAQVPILLAQKYGTIWVTAPSRISATGACNFVRQLYAHTGLTFGYAANSDIQYDKMTNVVYTTTGHMYRKMINMVYDLLQGKEVHFPKVLMIDESHHPSIDNYVLTKLIKWMMKKLPQHIPRIVVSSATFGIEVFQNDFPDAKVIEIKTPGYPVKVQYLKKSIDPRKLLKETATRTANKAAELKTNGTIIVFASGKGEIGQIIEYLQSDSKLRNVKICPLYSGLQKDEIQEATTLFNGVRIVVSTNMAESSITIPGTVGIVDTCRHKQMKLDETKRSCLAEENISLASAEQRKGRAGRQMPGWCLRMFTKEEYDSLQPFDKNEIVRADIYGVVLTFISIGYTPRLIINILELEEGRVNESLSRLMRLGMIERSDISKQLSAVGLVNPKGIEWKVTPMGKFATNFQVSPEMGCAIYLAVNNTDMNPQELYIVLVAAAYLETGQSFFWSPSKSRTTVSFYNEFMDIYCESRYTEATGHILRKEDYSRMIKIYRKVYHEPLYGDDDIETLLNIHELFSTRNSKVHPVEWAQTHSLNNKTCQSARNLLDNLVRSCKSLKIKITETFPKLSDNFSADLRAILFFAFADKLLKCKSGRAYWLTNYYSSDKMPFKITNGTNYSQLMNTSPSKVVAMSQLCFETFQNKQYRAGCVFEPTLPKSPKLAILFKEWCMKNNGPYIQSTLTILYNEDDDTDDMDQSFDDESDYSFDDD
jgi:HrpA-like RNA helicase